MGDGISEENVSSINDGWLDRDLTLIHPVNHEGPYQGLVSVSVRGTSLWESMDE